MAQWLLHTLQEGATFSNLEDNISLSYIYNEFDFNSLEVDSEIRGQYSILQDANDATIIL